MFSLIKSLFLSFVIVLFFGCSAKQTDGTFAQKAIFIKYNSTNQLNMFDAQSHVIPLVVYQLNDINAFESLAKDKAGIVKLLSAQKFDDSVTSVDKFFVAPNSKKTLSLNRAAKTSWVVLVAGYYDMVPSQSTLRFQIANETKHFNSMKFWDGKMVQDPLTMSVYFDESSIQKKDK